METSADRYLHKKFKKQLNVEPNVNQEGTRNVIKRVQIGDSSQNYRNSELVTNNVVISGIFSKTCDDILVTTNKKDVPKHSTNDNIINVYNTIASSNVAKSSISHLNVAERQENNMIDRIKPVEESVNPQSSNTCISYVISKNSRVENRNKPEAHFRTANFDTRYNVSEPIGIPTVGTSSILVDNVYMDQYVTSKIVHVDKLEDISSNCSVANNDIIHLQEGSCNILDGRGEQNYSSDFASVEKGSGGKYICSYCNLACSKPSVLQKHIRAHTNERPYPCVSCGFSFKTRSNLYKHCRSRTHANRVMGNKAQEINSEAETDSQTKLELDQNNSVELIHEENISKIQEVNENANFNNERLGLDMQKKPYKPRFHNSKAFFDNILTDNQKNIEDQKVPETVQNKPSNSELLSLHINDVINKNNAIVNSNESYLIRKRSVDNSYLENVNTNGFVHHRANEVMNSLEERNDEPLNLTNKTRKRCMSEVMEPTMHKSLIKELLLKNLYADSMQCPHCKMIFQTVTELELHKMRSCKGYTKSGAKYNRSSSVNVASILTKNKNAFDSISYLQSSTFPLKSPGPFLGNTRLVESDKGKSFSFDDSFAKFQNSLQNPNVLKSTLSYSLSPLHFENDRNKKTPVKLFGGEVKISQTTGTKSFKIDSKDSGDRYVSEQFLDSGERLSENRVVKSSLQSGGTVLQNKSDYNNKQDVLRSPSDVIRMYDNRELSSSIDLVNLDKNKFNYTNQNHHYTESKSNLESLRCSENIIHSDTINSMTTSYKYTNIMDFSQKAVNLLAPNLKQPNLTIPGVPMPVSSKLTLSHSPILHMDVSKPETTKLPSGLLQSEIESIPNLKHQVKSIESIPQKHIHLYNKKDISEQHLHIPNTICNPVNLFVDGKVVRYVPGMPGPLAAEMPLNVAYGNRSVIRPTANVGIVSTVTSPLPAELNSLHYSKVTTDNPTQSDGGHTEIEKRNTRIVEAKNETLLKLPEKQIVKSPLSRNDLKSPVISMNEPPKRFARPNTLALKPSISTQKQHHGLTPTMFNQILISPDTPRIAKKYMQHFLHGNYFSYLGLKSSTKSVYCTLNKTQPFYVPHFKKLSMYSEWRQQDIKGDKLYVSAYDSNQRQHKYVTAGKANADLVVHSSYKFSSDGVSKKDDQFKSSSILGGYESNEDYTYVRGRGRGRYVCDQCGIRCKKPSMLKKHIKTHTNDRPFTCNHCNFSFKTKGNLTKHMKSKAHTKNYAASSSSNSSAPQSGTQSSDSDTDDSGMDSSDESTRQHEAAYGLLSLSQKTTQSLSSTVQSENLHMSSNSLCSLNISAIESTSNFMNTEQVTQVNNSNFAKNKILDQQVSYDASKIIPEVISTDSTSKEIQNLNTFLGKWNINRPLTYPYTSEITDEKVNKNVAIVTPFYVNNLDAPTTTASETRQESQHISAFSIVQKHNVHYSPPGDLTKTSESRSITIPITISYDPSYLEQYKITQEVPVISKHQSNISRIVPSVKVNDRIVINSSLCDGAVSERKRKISEADNKIEVKLLKATSESEAMDLSMPSIIDKSTSSLSYNGVKESDLRVNHLTAIESNRAHVEPIIKKIVRNLEYTGGESSNFNHVSDRTKLPYKISDDSSKQVELELREDNDNAMNLKILPQTQLDDQININYVIQENNTAVVTAFTEVPSMDYDNSAMETLADVATKQVKLEKNILAKNVASEYLKLTTKNEFQSIEGVTDSNNFNTGSKEVNDLIVKPEENKNCTICSKSFSKPSQLRLHMNIHYLERPFRCDPCSVSFRTKGHFQKHERSAGHHNKLSSSPMFSSSEPRPFKCSDCNVAFRIHGHLAKHLRSKLHIMKLECLAKIPFGLYAELERANSLLTEINTTDGDQCLESLKALARKVFMNDPSKLNQLEVSPLSSTESSNS
ncbi:hypothetical protein RN001_000917 [Aquatica leii]|uniref:C2H2-type domain-containing protein n=1 Tax=Aquatica leii TaxID=1421715 RepID=A0AAN7PMV9_9COLE|nr:hypothetical protein RN001_000917 [Aquatica leii]